MHAPTDNTAPSRSEQAADPTHPPASNLVGIWARGRRRFTPWAFRRLRALAAVRFAAGLFLAGLGALLLSHGYHGCRWRARCFSQMPTWTSPSPAPNLTAPEPAPLAPA